MRGQQLPGLARAMHTGNGHEFADWWKGRHYSRPMLFVSSCLHILFNQSAPSQAKRL